MDNPKPTGGSRPIRILLACREHMLRAGLRILLARESDLEVVGEATDFSQAIRKAQEAEADVVLVRLSSLLAIEGAAWKDSHAATCGAHIIVLADASARREHIAMALKMGVRGIVWKNSESEILIEGIRSVVSGNIWLGKEACARVDNSLAHLAGDPGVDALPKTFSLTRREFEVLSKIVSGFSNLEIARALSISEDTVKHHITSIFDKVGASNRLELALFAFHHGLIRDGVKEEKK